LQQFEQQFVIKLASYYFRIFSHWEIEADQFFRLCILLQTKTKVKKLTALTHVSLAHEKCRLRMFIRYVKSCEIQENATVENDRKICYLSNDFDIFPSKVLNG